MSDTVVIIEEVSGPTVEIISTGPQGAQGAAGNGTVPGGLTGQALVKASDADFETEWKTFNLPDLADVAINAPEAGEVLQRTAAGKWENVTLQQISSVGSYIGGYEVVFSNLANKDVISFNANDSTWENSKAKELTDGGNF